MLKRLLALIGVLLCGLLWGSGFNEPLKIDIAGVDLNQNTLTFPSYDLKVGESGFVLTKLSDYNVISAKIQIESIKDGVAIAKFSDFDMLSQKYLPTPRIKPKEGDTAVFRELNNRAFLIAPDLATYEKAKSQIKDITLMSSDLLIAYLNDYGGFDPKPKFLKKACGVYNVGLLYIVSSDALNLLDCQSLVVLETTPLDTSRVAQTSAPFFSRLQEIHTGSLASLFYSKKSKNYFQYYDTLLIESFQNSKQNIEKNLNSQEKTQEEKPEKEEPQKEE